MKQWYIRKMVEAYHAGEFDEAYHAGEFDEAYHAGEFDEAMNYAKMAGVDIGDIARVAESEREVLE